MRKRPHIPIMLISAGLFAGLAVSGSPALVAAKPDLLSERLPSGNVVTAHGLVNGVEVTTISTPLGDVKVSGPKPVDFEISPDGETMMVVAGDPLTALGTLPANAVDAYIALGHTEQEALARYGDASLGDFGLTAAGKAAQANGAAGNPEEYRSQDISMVNVAAGETYGQPVCIDNDNVRNRGAALDMCAHFVRGPSDPNNLILGVKTTATCASVTSGQPLRLCRAWTLYPSAPDGSQGGRIVDWMPDGPQQDPGGRSNTIDIGLKYNGFGLGYKYTWYNGIYAPAAGPEMTSRMKGGQWTGCSKQAQRASHTQIVSMPYSTANYRRAVKISSKINEAC